MSTDELEAVIKESAGDIDLAASGDGVDFSVPNGPAAPRRLHIGRSLTPSAAASLVHGEQVGMVVADVIDSAAAETLAAAGWSFWDRRGRLRLWLPEIGVRIDVPTRSFVTGADGPDPRRPVAGRGGIAAALGLLLTPRVPRGVREVARLADMAASTISRSLAHLTHASLVGEDGTPLIPELFWATSDAWVPKPVPVDEAPTGDAWVLAADAAAAAWGAPVLGARRRYYCIDPSALDRHRFLHEGAKNSGVEVAVAPTPMVVRTAIAGIVHPVIAALDLSVSGRGREILDDWTAISDPPLLAEVVWK